MGEQSLRLKRKRLMPIRKRSIRKAKRRRKFPFMETVRSMPNEQFEQGFSYGYAEGLRSGQEQYCSMIEGTSIIIPSYNKLDMLKDCIDSIQKHTPNNHEIIVIDNASTDGTGAYLQSMVGKLRFHINESNRGFSGAVNTGLMMAKGQTICILNNDTLVTPNWLSNLLNCLHSDPNIGIVGPVTNYISGEQQIPVRYHDVNDMWKFAARYNKANPESWQYCDRIVGFCYLFTRSFFQATGFFDEGYEIGNFEDEDYIVRARLGGRKLVIARDTFIHHYGSQSMRDLGAQFDHVNNRNAMFFSAKWGNPADWINRMRRWTINERGETVVHHRAQQYFPTHVAATGLSETIYWIEHGSKYPLKGPVRIPVVRLSQVDLLGYPTGNEMDAALAENKWNMRTLPDGSIPDGAVFQTESGRCYQRQGEVCREFMTAHALSRWQLEGKVISRSEQERITLGEGFPIMAAPVIHAYHL
ncbi:glycosyltransferase family 2 protein [Paenibacillus marinisediminis]